jgi:hypothetical protein
MASEELPKPKASSEDKQREYDLQRYRKILKWLYRGSRHWSEIKVISYLMTFENTREDDLVAYLMRILNKSESYVRKTLKRMIKEGKIRQIVHKKLEPQVVYLYVIRFGIDLDYDLWTIAGIDSDGELEKYQKAIKHELRKYSKGCNK